MLCKFAAAMIGLIVAVGLPGVARSQQSAERPSPSSNEIPAASETEETAALTLEELEVLAAPIALYPDDLVALCIVGFDLSPPGRAGRPLPRREGEGQGPRTQ